MGNADVDVPDDVPDARELLLGRLGCLRGAVVRDLHGVSDEDGRWWPDGRLLPLLGVVNHLTHVELRWIDGGMLGVEVSRSEEEFFPGDTLGVADALAAYRIRAERTDATVRSLPLDTPSRLRDGVTLRWVLLHLINETARHAGNAEAIRELLDGTTGERWESDGKAQGAALGLKRPATPASPAAQTQRRAIPTRRDSGERRGRRRRRATRTPT